MRRRPPRSTLYGHTLSLHDALPISTNRGVADDDLLARITVHFSRRLGQRSVGELDEALAPAKLLVDIDLEPHRRRVCRDNQRVAGGENGGDHDGRAVVGPVLALIDDDLALDPCDLHAVGVEQPNLETGA